MYVKMFMLKLSKFVGYNSLVTLCDNCHFLSTNWYFALYNIGCKIGQNWKQTRQMTDQSVSYNKSLEEDAQKLSPDHRLINISFRRPYISAPFNYLTATQNFFLLFFRLFEISALRVVFPFNFFWMFGNF
jgi:hypothetical protein